MVENIARGEETQPLQNTSPLGSHTLQELNRPVQVGVRGHERITQGK
jgi:hypothetical protein